MSNKHTWPSPEVRELLDLNEALSASLQEAERYKVMWAELRAAKESLVPLNQPGLRVQLRGLLEDMDAIEARHTGDTA